MSKLDVQPDGQDELEVPAPAPVADLSSSEADLGVNAGTGADSGGTGAGVTALDAIGSDLKFDPGVNGHLKIKHKI